MKAKIINAIENKKIIEFIYDGKIRTVEPYSFGKSLRENEVIRAYQIGGFSSTGSMGWKLYDISKISSLQILDDLLFESRFDYKKGDKSMVLIYCEI